MNYKNDKTERQKNIRLLLLSIFCILVFSACDNQNTIIEQIRESGELRFATVESPLTYFKGSSGEAEGLEYELASMFADRLDVDLNLLVAKNKHDVTSLVTNNKTHIGASALSGYPDNTLEYGFVYITAKRQLIYNQKNIKPKSIAFLKDEKIVIVEDKSHQTLLRKTGSSYPDITERMIENKSMIEIFKMVNDNIMSTAVVDSNWADMYRYLFPEVRVAFDITGELPVAWIYRRNNDRSLHEEIRKFFNEINENGSLDKLISRYYKHAKLFDYIDTRVFIESIRHRLPKFKKLFMKSTRGMDLDWNLLAAMSYQESHWNPNAKSPTGVRGLMMLTIDTAKSLGVENRLDPEQSILGGARYLIRMKNRIPKNIQGEDRLWFALAAYNVGFGHLQDARKLTKSQGGDPNKWLDVKEKLPLLAVKKWYKKTDYGYARGKEPVNYVRNIQRYYNILKWKNAEAKRVVRQKKIIENKVLPIIKSLAL